MAEPKQVANSPLKSDVSVAKNLFFGEIVEENLFPYPQMRERDREMLGMMVGSSISCATWACSG